MRLNWIIFLFVAVGLLFVGTSCVSPAETALPTPAATGEEQVSATVLAAREAVLDFMREGAIISVPPEGAVWQTSLGQAPEGFQVYSFLGNHCAMTVSYPLEETELTLYHVTLNSKDVGLCWQANVDTRGKIVATGLGAEMFPELVNAAAEYCKEQDYLYTENPKSEENQCGMCTFPDGSMCNAWAFYQGNCRPGEFPGSGSSQVLKFMYNFKK